MVPSGCAECIPRKLNILQLVVPALLHVEVLQELHARILGRKKH